MKTSDKPLKAIIAETLCKLKRSDSIIILMSKNMLNILTEVLTKRRDELQIQSSDRLILLLRHLRQNVFAGLSQVAPNINLQSEGAGGRPYEALEAADAILLILTTPDLPREVFSEKVIDHVVQLARRLLEQTIYPAYDPNYVPCGTVEPNATEKGKKMKKPPIKVLMEKSKSSEQIYAKLVVLVEHLCDYFDVEGVDDTSTLLEVLKLTIETFFVESVAEIRNPSLKIIKQMSVRHECSLPIWEILVATAMRLTGHQRNAKCCPLDPAGNVNVSTFSALVLQLLHDSVDAPGAEDVANALEARLEKCQRLCDDFLRVFILRLVESWDDRDCKQLFETFVADLVAVMFHPRWPVAEALVNKLARHLQCQMLSKSVDAQSRLSYVDMFGCLALRRCQLDHQLKPQAPAMSEMLQAVRDDLEADAENSDHSSLALQAHDRVLLTRALQRNLLTSLALAEPSVDDGQPNVATSTEPDPMWSSGPSARLYLIAAWTQDLRLMPDLNDKPVTPGKGGNSAKRRALQSNQTFVNADLAAQNRDILLALVGAGSAAGTRVLSPAQMSLVSRYLAVSRMTFKTCSWFVDQLLTLISDSSVNVRNRLTRFIRQLAELDTGLLNQTKIQRSILALLGDKSACVRESMADMVGKMILVKPDLVNAVFNVVINMLQDPSLCVKKRCVRLLREVAAANPEFPHLNVFSAHVLARVSDDGMQRIVMETLEQVWFTMPMTQAQLESRTNAIVCVGTANAVPFQTFLTAMLGEREGKTESMKVQPPESTLAACRQIVQHLIISLTTNNEGLALKRSQMLATLYYLAKVQPAFATKHTVSLLQFVNTFDETEEEKSVMRFAVQILELTLPSVAGLEAKVAAAAERAFIEALGPTVPDSAMVSSCVTCLAAIVRRVTRNYNPVKKLFRKSLTALKDFKHVQIDALSPVTREDFRPVECPSRHVFIVGMVLKRFDIVSLGYSNMTLGKPIAKECLEILCAIAKFRTTDNLNVLALKAIGQVLVRHPNFMMSAEVKNLYRDSLLACSLHNDNGTETNLAACVQILRNIVEHIVDEERLSARNAAEDSNELDEDYDECQSMARTLVSIHLTEILQTAYSPHEDVRGALAVLLEHVIKFGVVATHQVIPHMVLLCCDPCSKISQRSLLALSTFHASQSMYLPNKLLQGVKMLYGFLAAVQPQSTQALVRGWQGRGDDVTAVISGVYMLIRSNQSDRRLFLDSVLKQFDQSARTPLRQLLFLADILAHLPYLVTDEPMYLVHRLEMICTVANSDLKDDWNELANASDTGSSEGDRVQMVSTSKQSQKGLGKAYVRECIVRSHGHRLLVALKGSIKTAYNITDSKVAAYNPSQTKTHERQAARRTRPPFEPTAVLDAIKRGQDHEEDIPDPEQDFFDLKHLMTELDPLDVETQERFDHKVAALNERLQRQYSDATRSLPSSSGKKRDYTDEKGIVGVDNVEAPKKRKSMAKNSTGKEEAKVAGVRDPSRGRKLSKRLF